MPNVEPIGTPLKRDSRNIHLICFCQMALNVGSINAILNVLLWLAHSVLSFLVERTYFRLANHQLKKQGRTDSTDTGEVHASNWLFRFVADEGSQRKNVAWWSIVLMVLLSLILPSELVFETGIYERKDCSPETRISSGICASPWKGQGNVFVSSTSLLTAYANWVDEKWEVVLEGSRKKPRVNEVRKITALKAGRRFVLASCDVRTSQCSSAAECGTLTIWKSGGTYGTIVSSSSLYNATRGKYCFGDVTFDGSLGVAFIFWEELNTRRIGLRKPLSVLGIETVLNEKESLRVAKGRNVSWNLVVAPARTRLYEIQCDSDGLTAKDLAHAIGIYRTMQMEEPGVRRDDVMYNISRLKPMSSSDVLKSAFALKSEDGSDTCTGEVEVYVPCGDFRVLRLLPFVISAALLGFGWIIVKILFPESGDKVPVDTPAWRLIAHNQAIALRCLLQKNLEKTTHSGDESAEQKLEENIQTFHPEHVSWYSHKKFEAQIPKAFAVQKATTSDIEKDSMV